jgi:PGF-CTERM protein
MGLAAGNTLDAESVGVSSSPSVDVGHAFVSQAGNAQIDVAYDVRGTGVASSDLRVSLIELGGSTLDTASYDGGAGRLDGSGSGTVSMTIPESQNSDFTGFVQVFDVTSPGTTIAKDQAEIYVRDVSGPPAVDLTTVAMEPFKNERLAIGYDAGGGPGSDLELRLFNDTSDTKLRTVSGLADGSAGGEFLRLPSNGSDFTARLELWNTDTDAKLATDTASVTVGLPSVSPTSKQIDPSTSTAIDVSYDAGPYTASQYRISLMAFDGTSTTQLGSKMVGKQSGTASVDVTSGVPSDQSERLTVIATYMTNNGQFLGMGQTCIGVSEDPCPSIASTSVEYADGSSAPNLEGTASIGSFGMIDAGIQKTGTSNYNISTVSGVDSTTELWLNLTVDDANVGGLMGSADVSDWFVTSVDSNTNVTHIKLSPAEVFRNQTINSKDPSQWPSGQWAATTKRTQAKLSLMDMSMLPGDMGTTMRNATLTTDAQAFRPPMTAQQNGETVLQLQVAGPHYETDGSTQNTGFYDAFIPSGLLDQMNVSDPAELAGTYQGSNLDMTVTEVNGGMRVSTDIHYSSGTITLKPTTTSSPSIDISINPNIAPSATSDDTAAGSTTAAATTDGQSTTDATDPTDTVPSPGSDSTPPTADASTADQSTDVASETAGQPTGASPTATDSDGPAETTAASGPGFSVGVALVAVLATALLARRRGRGR